MTTISALAPREIGRNHSRGLLWFINILVPAVLCLYWIVLGNLLHTRWFYAHHDVLISVLLILVFAVLVAFEITHLQRMHEFWVKARFWKECKQQGIYKIVKDPGSKKSVLYYPIPIKVNIYPDGRRFVFTTRGKNNQFLLKDFEKFYQELASLFFVPLEDLIIQQVPHEPEIEILVSELNSNLFCDKKRIEPKLNEVELGTSFVGEQVFMDLFQVPSNLLIVGRSRSGKTSTCYQLLSSLLIDYDEKVRKNVRIVGVDPSSLFLNHLAKIEPHISLGQEKEDVERAIKVLQWVASEVNRRTDVLRQLEHDKFQSFEFTKDNPLLIVVLEEFMALVSVAESYDPKMAKQLKLLLKAIVSQGLKTGVMAMLISQRADSFNFGDGSTRAQFGSVILHASDLDGARMVMPSLNETQLDAVLSLRPGECYYMSPVISEIMRVRVKFETKSGWDEAVDTAIKKALLEENKVFSDKSIREEV
jgi:hypothetical protein